MSVEGISVNIIVTSRFFFLFFFFVFVFVFLVVFFFLGGGVILIAIHYSGSKSCGGRSPRHTDGSYVMNTLGFAACHCAARATEAQWYHTASSVSRLIMALFQSLIR